MSKAVSIGGWRWIRRSAGPISTARPWRATQGARSNYTNLRAEPADHGLGRSRGGLSTKIHHLCDGHGLPLVVLIGPGHAHDSPMFEVLMGQLRVPRAGRGRPRTRPQAVLGDQAYSSRANRAHLRSRGISAVIPEQSTHSDHRRRRGSRGGRPVGFDAQKYKNRNVIERSFNTIKNWRGLATRYDKLAVTYRAAAVLAAICAWLRHLRDTP
jgi:transposase